MELLEKSRSQAQNWLNSSAIDEETKNAIKELLNASEPRELIDRFYKNLEFGTGGLRGTMGVGPNCMNKYTIGAATQGLANYLRKSFPGENISVAIAYDSRNNSSYFAQVTADVFTANGIEVWLFPELRPTPLLSFAIRQLKCKSGVVITASHNPKEYNGYKAYWQDGAQLVPPHDLNVTEEVNAISGYDQIRFKRIPELVHTVGPEIEQNYYQEVLKLIPGQDAIKRQKNISIVYSSIHGAGITMVPEILRKLGFENVHIVEEQKKPDGNFPTVKSPNPEERSAMEMALEQGKIHNAELIMATDPDTDRVGIAIRDNRGEFLLLNGNQALSIMLWFIMKNLDMSGFPKYVAKTIVTTELIDTMAAQFGVECINTLTGFKYIAELIRQNEGKKDFVAAGEESYGYMVGPFVRDKDAVSSCAFFASLAAAAADSGQTMFDWMLQVYKTYGYYREGLVNLVRKGAEGEKEIREMMNKLRQNPPITIAGNPVIRMLDYQAGIEQNFEEETTKPLDFPKSDVLQFYTKDGSKISVRPSGTEPKIKFYISVRGELSSKSDFESETIRLDNRIDFIQRDFIS
ncbi:MAG: phospho-sugar mutase [Cyclobacteriaceae bacterium]